jgi:type II secretory pathway pseudopilin PulG
MTPTTSNQNPLPIGAWIGVIAIAIAIIVALVFYLAISSRATADNKAEAEQKARAVAAQTAAEYIRNQAARSAAQLIPEDPEYPRSGEVYPTKATPVKAWIDPGKTHTRAMATVKYCVVDHPKMCWTDQMNGRDDTAFRNFPAGRYIVSPLGDDEVYFRWWQ